MREYVVVVEYAKEDGEQGKLSFCLAYDDEPLLIGQMLLETLEKIREERQWSAAIPVFIWKVQ